MTTWIIFFALALLSIVVFVFALRSQQDAEALEDRLAGTIDEEAASHPHQAGGIEPLPEWIQPAARFGLKLAGNDKSRETTALLLAQAGFARPGSLGVFLLLKTMLGLGIAAALFFGTQERSIGTIALMGAGYFAGGILPEWILKSMAARRYTALERSMPDALDLMVICAEAGLPFTRIVKVVSRELELSAPVLAHELALTNAELEIMPERSAALRNLAFVQFMTGSADRSRETLQSFMTNEQAEDALKKFAAMKSRIDAGESTLADECLRAAEKMIEIRPKSADDSDYGYEVPLVVEPVKTIETKGAAGLSSHAQTFPKGSPEAAAALEALKKGSAGQNGSKP